MSNWISVEYKLPHIEKEVLLLLDYGDYEVRIGYYSLYGVWMFGDSMDVAGASVTHWMPLPEPPKEREG